MKIEKILTIQKAQLQLSYLSKINNNCKCDYWVKRYNGIVQLLMLQKYGPLMH